LRKLLEPEPPPGKLGRLPLVPPLSEPAPPPNAKPPARGTPDAPLALLWVPKSVQEPLDVGVVTLMERAAIVVLDFFDAVPVTETQSPAAKVLTAWDTVLENDVVAVQLTVVWPEVGFCTSMLEPLRAATLPEAPIGRLDVVAALAEVATAASVTTTVAPPPRHRTQRRRFERGLVNVCISLVPLSLVVSLVRSREFTVSLLLVAQGVDRGQGRGAARGVHPEEDTDR
jgi:hypothetical protein